MAVSFDCCTVIEPTVALSLATLTVATVLSLIPPAATKFVVDYVLGGKPLPANVPAWVPRDPWLLLLDDHGRRRW